MCSFVPVKAPKVKKVVLWTMGILLSPVLLLLILILLLYIPPIQNWAVKQAAAYASEQTGMDIQLDRVRISFPFDIDLQQLTAKNPDTVLDVDRVIVDLNFSSIFRGHLGVDALDIQDGTVNTQDLIASLVVKGHLGNFHLNADDIALRDQRVSITGASLYGCDLDIALRDTTIEDTTESTPILWKIGVDDIRVQTTRLAFHMPGDTLSVKIGVQDLALQGGDVDLGANIYKVRHLKLLADSILYDQNYENRQAEGFDYNHVDIRDVELEVEDLSYSLDDNALGLYVKHCKGKEQSGLEMSSLSSHVRLDSTSIHLPDLALYTTNSQVEGEIDLDWSALSPGSRGHLSTKLDARIGRGDIVPFALNIVGDDVLKLIPEDPITLRLEARGNVDTLHVEEARLFVSPMADAQVHGLVTNLMDNKNLSAQLQWNVQTFDLRTLAKYLNLGKNVRLPQMKLTGSTTLDHGIYAADLKMQQGKGYITLKGEYNEASEVYAAKLNAKNFPVQNFLPKDSLYDLSANAQVSGRGLDIYKPSTRMTGKTNITHLRYGHQNLDNIQLTAKLRDGRAVIDASSDNGLIAADACAEAIIGKKLSLANFSLDLNRVDLYALGITSKPLKASLLMHVDGSSNLSDTHQMNGKLQAIELQVTDTVYHPLDLEFSLYTDPDSLFLAAYDGDLELELKASDGWERIMKQKDKFVQELTQQIERHYIDQDVLRSLLPTANLHLKSGAHNPIGNILASIGYSYEQLHFDLDSDPARGLNGDGYMHKLNTGAVLLDTIQWHVYQDSTGVLNLASRVKNGPKNKQVTFEASVDATLTPNGANARLQFFDARGARGVDLGAELTAEEEGLRLHFTPLDPVIAYRGFALNPGNYILLHPDNHIEADVDLLADDGTGFKLYSTPNETALQDITLQVHDFNLGELSRVLPYLPTVTGLLSGDFHLLQEEKSTSVLVDANVKDMTYEGAPMGTVGLNAVYLPNSDGTHYVDGIVTQNGNEVLLLAGTYTPDEATGGLIDAEATLQRLPLNLANGFIPNQMMELEGYVLGQMQVSGPVSSPVLDGALATDSMRLRSDMYSLNLRFPDDTIRVQQSILDFNRIEAYSSGRNPVVLDGSINMQHLDAIALNLDLTAHNFELIKAPKTRKAVAYGQVYVDLDASLRGQLQNMLLRGQLTVLGNTDVTYVLTDSPLTVEDQLSDLVTFVDFTDSTVVEEVRTAPQNIDMVMDISIQQAAQVHCLLSADGVNYVNLEGGGDLTMTYSTRDDLHLYGRYTIVTGEMNYTLMVMALKDLKMTSGSYVEWSGDLMNPRLNLSAVERVKTTVTENNVPRSVVFEVGLDVSQTLDNMGLSFTLDAPEDMSISNQLATMGQEERGKVAVTMLATGMYITEGGNGTSGLSTTNALNAFLQNQISAISNRALGTIDLNLGVDNTNTASGALQTDYSFSFAKRFWGNRINLIVGGKVSSGSEAVNTGQSIIDNVSLEYRLDKSATRYVRLYYDRNTKSLLEGEIMEMGAGIVLRRKSTRLGELFIFRKKE